MEVVGAGVVEDALEPASPVPPAGDAAVLGEGEEAWLFAVAGCAFWSGLSLAALSVDSVEPAWSGAFILSE